MSLVFEDPPTQPGPGGGSYRERSPLRKEIDDMLDQLRQYPERWAKLFTFNEKEEAEQMATKVRTAAGKGWNVATRQVGDRQWSVFARTRPPKPEDEAQEREPTFQ